MYSVDKLRQSLSDIDPGIRRDACELVGDGRKTELLPEVVSLLADLDQSVREAAINALTAIRGTEVASSVAPLLKSEDVALRNIGIEVLQDLGPDALSTISYLLNDKDDDVVKFAIDLIANTRDENAGAMLLKHIDHANPNVRASVALCLGRIRAKGAIGPLLKAAGDAEEWVRFSAIEGLGYLEDASAFEPLLEMMDKDSVLIKDAALEALSRLSTGRESGRVLLKIQNLIKDRSIHAIDAVFELVEKAFSPSGGFKPSEELRESLCRFFSEALNEADKAVAEKALKGMGLVRCPQGLDKVFAYADSLHEIDEDMEAVLVDAIVSISGTAPLSPVLRDRIKKGGPTLMLAVKAIGETRSEEGIELLAGLIDRVDQHELRTVIGAIESIGLKSSAQVLLKSLFSTDGHTRKISARALLAIAGEEAVKNVFEALRAEKYRDVMEGMTDSLAGIPSDEVRDGFCGLLKGGGETLRVMAARGLGVIGDESAIESLKGATLDSSPEVRKAAYKSLAKLGITDAEDIVLEGLKDLNDDVRISIVKALTGWGGDKIKAAVIRALGDVNMWVRYHAVMMLAEMPDADVIRALIRALAADEPPVKAAVARAFASIGTEECAEALKAFVDHPDENVRSAVREALEQLKCSPSE